MPITFDDSHVTFDQLITFDTTGLSSGASMGSVSARRFVNSIPSVLVAGGAALGMNAIAVDNSGDTSIPIGGLQKFGNSSAVSAWYGVNSPQAAIAGIYFSGFNNASQIPSALYFAQYNVNAAAGYLRSGSLSGTALSQIQALSGTITVAIDGVSHTSAAINLSSASSFSNAAALIQAGIQAGTPSSTATCIYDSLRQAFVITSSTTGGTSSVAFPATGSLASGLLLTAAAGAIQSAGAAAATPAGVMTQLTTLSQDWATFMTVVDPDAGAAGGPIKQQFANWNATQGEYYLYVAYDSDPTPSTTLPDSACFAQQVASIDGTFPIWSALNGPLEAAFVCGLVAAINFNAPNGRTNLAFRSSPALSPDITSDTLYGNVTGDPDNPGNGYNCYARVGTRQGQFSWLQRGTVTGAWKYADSYINQIYWNALFQNDFAIYLNQVGFIPYTTPGYTGIRQSIMSDIVAMGAFGAWVAGGTLSSEQANQANALCGGLNVAPTIQTQGWYLFVADPGPTVRASRGSPIVIFLYFDGQSVNGIFMSAVDLE
jgi:hypothetical protein